MEKDISYNDMKQSIGHLPQTTQEELNYLVESIARHIPKCAMAILYGSFARGGYVLWDEKIEFGVHTSYQSDLDLLVVTNESNARITEWQPFANGFLKHARIALEDKMYELGAFELHQACERCYYSIGLVFVNYRPKSHKLKDLESKCKRFSRNITRVFPLHTEFEKHCYDLLCRAYIESRYNIEYVVKKEELEYMLQRTELLKEITHTICTEQLIAYDGMIEAEDQKHRMSYSDLEQENTADIAADELRGYKDSNGK